MVSVFGYTEKQPPSPVRRLTGTLSPGGRGGGEGPHSPAARLEQLLLIELGDVYPRHRGPQIFGAFGDDLRVVIVRGGSDDGLGALVGIGRLEDTRANEASFRAQLHD